MRSRRSKPKEFQRWRVFLNRSDRALDSGDARSPPKDAVYKNLFFFHLSFSVAEHDISDIHPHSFYYFFLTALLRLRRGFGNSLLAWGLVSFASVVLVFQIANLRPEFRFFDSSAAKYASGNQRGRLVFPKTSSISQSSSRRFSLKACPKTPHWPCCWWWLAYLSCAYFRGSAEQ